MVERVDSFGDWVRRRRKALDLTQAGLADRVSCSQAAIRKIEAEERRPSRALAQRLAQHLGVPAPQHAAFVHAARQAQPPTLRAGEGPPQQAAAGVAEPDAPATPLVGRAEPLAAVGAALLQAQQGSGGVVLVQGEAGIGKSRLLQEAVQAARLRGMPALTTNCYEIERAIAYQPIIDLASQACSQLAPERLRDVPPVLLAELAELVPTVALQVPGLPALSTEFPEARQARLFQALVQLFDAAMRGRGLLVTVDNLQWADDASVCFLHHYARQIAGRGVLLVGTLRDDELDASAELRAAVASLRGETHARHVLLPRLTLAHVETLLQELAPPLPAASGVAARLLRESEGNPFFLWSVLHAWGEAAAPPAEEATALPLPLRDSVRARLARVPRQERALLDLAAVLGRRFHFESLLALGKAEAEDVVEALENLEHRRLLRQEAQGGHYDFSHDKVREVVYQDIGAARRVLLHREVAQHLEARAGAQAHELHGLLAEHFERGQLWPQALHFLALAAGQSARLFAIREALQWFDRAIALLEAHPEAATPLQRLALHERRGAARAQAGRTEGAVDDFQQVIAQARALGDAARARDALVSLGMAYRRADHYEPAIACLDEALAAARGEGQERQVADILYHLGTVAWSNGRNDLALAYHQEAVDLCERLRLDDLVAVQACHGRGEAALAAGQPLTAIDFFSRSLALARAAGDPGYEAENLMMIGWSHLQDFGTGEPGTALRHLDAALEIVRTADLHWHLGPTLVGRAHALAGLGRTQEARVDLEEALREVGTLGLVRYRMMAHDGMGTLHLAAGEPGAAAHHFERALVLAGSAGIRYWLPRVQAGLALARTRAGAAPDLPQIEAAVQEARRHRESWVLPRCLEALAEAALARGDGHCALAHAGELAALAAAGSLAGVAQRAAQLRQSARDLAPR